MIDKKGIPPISERFRGFLPVVIDLETGGFNCKTDALLEFAAVLIDFNDEGMLVPEECFRFHVEPFEGANIEPASLEITGIDPHHPLRPAIPERDALGRIFREVRNKLRETNCKRAVLVAHNAHFDLGFLNEAITRTGIKRSPFHPFSVFDTATLGGIAYGQTVLARMADAAGMKWDSASAHSAAYDAEQTAEIFCKIVNSFKPIYDARKPAIDP
ncbi:MAG: ribonuclease T [Gammaproteobacteria bacterium]|nr:ribonuclease T [Gammaproteobacteria bacterium]MCP4091045.1 ribonuclease T [Gammaproteobacteria bacterium]MCP4277429.1 ribonuclease T [Gammaproteobacteria bacterium]MCP4831510.1 ribonuclease T [Gammaproteobacteria bacterium]MCP4927733.1 ribonuclease T [Gammaproteobacteria bacterium]